MLKDFNSLKLKNAKHFDFKIRLQLMYDLNLNN